MQLCKYHTLLKCTTCKYAYHKKCSKFVLARAKELTTQLPKFQYTSIALKHKVVVSVNKDRACSAALQYAYKQGLSVLYITCSQALEFTIDSGYPTDHVIFLDLSQPIKADLDKVQSVLTSFVEHFEAQNQGVVIYNPSNKMIRFPRFPFI